MNKEQAANYELALEAATITTMNGAASARGFKSIAVRIGLFAWLLPASLVGATCLSIAYNSWLIAVCSVLIYAGWVSVQLSCMLALSVAGEVHIKKLADMIYADFEREQAQKAASAE